MTAVLPWVVLGLVLTGLVVLSLQVVAVGVWPPTQPASGHWPPVSILKPLYGDEPRLYECLRSFCVQDYPQYEVVFGVRDPDDPAIASVERLRKEFPGRRLALVVDPRLLGSNAKASNLAHIMGQAQHDILVLADADIRVGPDYLKALAGPVQEEDVGVVTCLYRGFPIAGFWSRFATYFIHDWFVPQVLLARLLGSQDFAFGATIALRRGVLTAIGGFEALASQLADDYELGARSRARGLRTVLSSYVVETTVNEPGLSDLFWHQLRWLRTIRLINPWGYAFSWTTFGFPLSVVGAFWLTQPLAASLVFLALLLRLMLHFRACGRLGTRPNPWLVPLADFWLSGLWVLGFLGQGVRWRGQTLAVCADGSIRANRE